MWATDYEGGLRLIYSSSNLELWHGKSQLDLPDHQGQLWSSDLYQIVSVLFLLNLDYFIQIQIHDPRGSKQLWEIFYHAAF